MNIETTCTPSRQGTVRPWALGLLAAALLLTGCESQADRDQKAADAAYREKLAKAKAIFAERCKTAGVVIHRTVRDVEGIELKKVRPTLEHGDNRYFDPMWSEAAMASEARGEDYIKQFLMYDFPSSNPGGTRGYLGPLTPESRTGSADARQGYRFVEFFDPATKKLMRCVADWSGGHTNWVNGQHRCSAVEAAYARYAVDYEDLVDLADRAFWVAGSKLRVIDREKGEVIAEMTRFVMEPGFGSNASGRRPWQIPSSMASLRCPGDANQPTTPITRYFVDTVLIPKQGD